MTSLLTNHLRGWLLAGMCAVAACGGSSARAPGGAAPTATEPGETTQPAAGADKTGDAEQDERETGMPAEDMLGESVGSPPPPQDDESFDEDDDDPTERKEDTGAVMLDE